MILLNDLKTWGMKCLYYLQKQVHYFPFFQKKKPDAKLFPNQPVAKGNRI